MNNRGNNVRPANTKKSWSNFFSLLKPYKGQLTLVLAGLIVSSLVTIAGMLFLQKAIDGFIEPLIGKSNPDLSGFITALAIMAAIYLVGVIASFISVRLMVNVSAGTMDKVRNRIFVHMQSLSIKYHDTHTHGELMSRFTNDTDTLRDMISNTLPQAIGSFFSIIGTIISMLILSPFLTLIVFVVLAVMGVFIIKFAKTSGKYFIKQQQSLGKMNGYIEELMEGQKVVKVFNYENKVGEEFGKITDELCYNSTTALTYANFILPLIRNLSFILYVVVALVGSVLIISPNAGILTVSIGTLIAFMQLSRNISQPIIHVSQQFNSILVALAGVERIFEVLNAESEENNGYVTLVNAEYDENGNLTPCEKHTGIWAWKHFHKADNSTTYKKVDGAVEFLDVTFGYEENKTVLKNVSLYAKPGQKVALVGSTGAGKTTITNLINRFYDVPDGKIRYDGININKINKNDLRRSLGMVLQDTYLFTGTVMDNIRYGNLSASDEECMNAAVLANADSFIKRLPKGYNTEITANGANLSQGQRQLLSIARAAVANPPVLILDEATSSIDTRTEKLVENGMDSLMKGRTVFVIAHRLSTIRNADAIMVIENGEIIERGNHESLLKKKGRYYQLHKGVVKLT